MARGNAWDPYNCSWVTLMTILETVSCTEFNLLSQFSFIALYDNGSPYICDGQVGHSAG